MFIFEAGPRYEVAWLILDPIPGFNVCPSLFNMICFFLCVSCFNSIYLSNNTIHEAWPWFSYHTTAGLHYFDLEGDHGPICQGPPARFLWGYTRKIENTFGPALATWHQQSEIRGLCETHSFEFDSTFPSSHPHCPRKDLLLDNWSQTVQDDIEAKQQLRKKTWLVKGHLALPNKFHQFWYTFLKPSTRKQSRSEAGDDNVPSVPFQSAAQAASKECWSKVEAAAHSMGWGEWGSGPLAIIWTTLNSNIHVLLYFHNFPSLASLSNLRKG